MRWWWTAAIVVACGGAADVDGAPVELVDTDPPLPTSGPEACIWEGYWEAAEVRCDGVAVDPASVRLIDADFDYIEAYEVQYGPGCDLSLRFHGANCVAGEQLYITPLGEAVWYVGEQALCESACTTDEAACDEWLEGDDTTPVRVSWDGGSQERLRIDGPRYFHRGCSVGQVVSLVFAPASP